MQADVERLLGRKSMQFMQESTCAYYEEKVILISGGGGSIGSELCRQLAHMKPKKLILLDICENGAYDVQQELKMYCGTQLEVCIEIASICDRDAIEMIFARYRPDIILHAAAHKHVPLMERNCCEAVHNNVFGTLNMVEVSEKYAVDKFILISTDKAVNPVSVMGSTKRMCEMIVRGRRSKTCFCAVRFGNVFGSNGSVVPLFMRQIFKGGPITITDKRATRFFMTISEAAQLVLESVVLSEGGELYVLNMGEPMRILDLAENMIRLHGLKPYEDVDIVESGLREGEKLHEELLGQSMMLKENGNQMIFLDCEPAEDAQNVERKLEYLRQVLKMHDDDKMKSALKQVIYDK